MAVAGTLEIQLLANIARLQNDMDKATRSVGGAMGNIEKSVNLAKNAFRGLVGGIGLLEILKVTDQYTKLNAQLKIASRNQADYAKSMQDVIRISNSAQTSLEGTATLYARLANTLKDTNVTQQQFANITESVALGLRVSGASTAEAQSAMLQLSQAFASGVLRGEEFNAVSEASFPLMKALADSMGIPIEQLRSMAQEGKITRNELVKAFGDPALIDSFRAQSKELNTVGGALTSVKNSLLLATGQFDKATGFSNFLASALNGVSIALDGITAAANNVPFDAITRLLPAYAAYKKQLDSENKSLAIGGTQGSIIPRGLRMDEIARTDIGKLGEVSEEFKKIQASFAEFAKTTPLKDAISKSKEYTSSLELLAEAEAKGIVSMQEAQRYRAQLREEYEKSNKTANKSLEDALKREEEVRKYMFNLEKELDDEVTKRYNQAVKIREKDDKEEYERKAKYVELLQKQANENYKEAQEVYKRQVSEYERIFERANDNLSRSLTDSIVRGFERGEKFITNFKNAITNAFRSYFVNIGVNFVQNALSGVVSKAGGSLLDLVGMGNGSSNQAGGGFGGALSDLGNIFTSSNQSIISGIESLGGQIANGMGGIRDTIGGYLGANASFVANAASYAGAVLQLSQGNWAGAAGTAIGTALGGPIGGAIGSFLGGAVGGLFGGKDIPMTGDQAKTSYNAGNITTKTNTFGKSSLGGKDALTQANEAFAKTYGALITQFDANAKFTIDTIYRSRTNTQGFFRFNGQSLQSGSQKGISFEGFIKKFMGEGLADVIRRSTEIPKAFRDLFIGIKKPEAVEAVVMNVIKLNENATQLQSTLGITAEQVALLAKESGIAGENLTLLVNTVTGVSSELFTVGDALVKIKSNIDSTFAGLSDSALPANLKAFDDAIKALDKTTAQGRQDFLGLIQLRGQFAEFEKQIGNIRGGVKGALFGIVSDAERQQIMNEDLAKMFAELNMTVPGSIQELIALGKSIDYTTASGLNLALAFPTLVDAFNTTRGAVDSLINSLTSSRFQTFADYAIGTSLARQGVPINQIPTMGASAQSSGTNDNRVAELLTRLIAEVSEMKTSTQQTADNTLRTTRELEDITGGNVTLSTTTGA